MGESVRIVVLDFYMSPPIPGLDVTYSEFRGASVSQVPILRCFGSTENGDKICVHIHGVFPYLYIPYDGAGNADGLMYQIAAGIDKAVNISLNQGSSFTQHVYKICLVSGIPMYGYHPKKHQFFKIYLYNPMLVSTVTNLLLNQSVLGMVFQPHEAHINFTLQFMIDYNLHGMSNMVISELKYRVNPDKQNAGIDEDLFLPASIEKITLCELEADINAEHIVNRQEIISGNLAVNPGIAALWADEKQRRRNKSEDSQLGPFLELTNMKCTPTKTHSIFQQALAERLAVSSTDKHQPEENLNVSVYPAETPNSANIQNASIIDIHTPSSLELSLDDTLNFSSSQLPNDSITPTQQNLNVTLDEDEHNFLQLLEKLAEEKKANETEEDSILSQNVNVDEQNADESNEDFLDLSMPLAAVTTPKKVDTKCEFDRSDEEDDDYFNTTLIPQVDGQTEMSDTDREQIGHLTQSKWRSGFKDVDNNFGIFDCSPKKIRRNGLSSHKPNCGKSMPLLDMDIFPSVCRSTLKPPLDNLNMISFAKLHRIGTAVNTEPQDSQNIFNITPDQHKPNKRTRRTPEERIETNLRLIRYRINRINNKNKIKRIGKNIHRKELMIGTLLKKFLRPKFNVLPARNWFLEPSQKDDPNSSIISCLTTQTHNYTDPTLHLLIRYSNNQTFIYNYAGKTIPDVTELPSHLSESEQQKIVFDLCKSCSNHKNEAIKKKKTKIMQNKILNIKKKKVIEEKNRCEVMPTDLPDTLKMAVPIESPINNFLLTKENDVRTEVEKANPTIPEVTQLPTNLTESEQQKIVFDLYKSSSNSNNEKKCMIKKKKTKIMQNKIFNIKKKQVKEEKNRCEVMPTVLPGTLKMAVSIESPINNFVLTKENDVRTEVEKANPEVPEVTELPTNLSDSEQQKIVFDLCKSCSNPKNQKKCMIRKRKTKIMQNKILNIKKKKVKEEKNRCEVMPTDLPDTLKMAVPIESPINNFVLTKENDMRTEVEKANPTIHEVTELPTNLSESEQQKIVFDLCKSCSNPKNEKKCMIKKEKTKIMQNKILNIKKKKVREEKNRCEVMPTVLKDTMKMAVPVESPIKIFLLTKKNDVRTEVEKASPTIHEVTELPTNLTESEQQKIVFDLCKSCSNPKNEKKCMIRKKKTKIMQNKILNIKKKKVREEKNRCEVMPTVLKDTMKMAVPVESPINNCVSTKRESFVEFEKDVIKEVEMANLTLQKHIKHLRDFDIHKSAMIKKEMCSLKEEAQLGDDVRDQDMKDVLFHSSNDNREIEHDFSILKFARQNVITPVKREEYVDHCDKDDKKTIPFPAKILSDIGNRYCNNNNYNFESCKKFRKRITSRLPYYIDSSSEESDSGCENNYFPAVSAGYEPVASSSQYLKPENIPCNQAKCSGGIKFERNFSTSSIDSDYVSVSTNTSGRNTSHEYNNESSSTNPSNYINLSRTSPISFLGDIKIESSLQVQYSPHTVNGDPYLNETDRSSFENGADYGKSIEPCCSPEKYEIKLIRRWNQTHTQPHVPKTIKNNHCSTANMYINCDGAVDSSSDEEKIITKCKKRIKRAGAVSPYVPLPIHVTKSPRVRANCSGKGLAESMLGTSTDLADFEDASSTVVQIKSSSKSDVIFKRKLNFENNSPLDQTTFEECLSCAYSPRNISKTKISTNFNKEDSNLAHTEETDTNFDENSNNSQSMDGSNSQQLDTTLSDSDLFSEDEDMNKSFFKNCQLPMSEKYDRETKYKPREGCSTIFTPGSIPTPKILSNESMSDNTSSGITPYQAQVNNVASPDNNSSDITPYQVHELSNNETPMESTSSDILKLIRPSMNAPSRLQVERSLEGLKIAQVKVEEPFYSSVEDYTGSIEIGHSILRIPSKSSSHFPDFESDFDGLTKYRKYFIENVANLKWNSNNLKNLKLSHCSNRLIMIRPLKKPPSVATVRRWVDENSKAKDRLPVTPDVQTRRSKIYIPNSPGNDQDDLELSLSVTPCTPATSQVSLAQSSEVSTPKSSQNSQRKKKTPSLGDLASLSQEENKSCEITGVTQHNTFGFDKSVQNLRAARAVLEHQNLTTMVMELHISTRGDLKPDPEYDPICAIFYSVLNDVPDTCLKKSQARGVVASNCLLLNKDKLSERFLDGIAIDCDITYAETEEAVINQFLDLVKYWDPDIFAGYEIQMLSWGYLIDRAFVLSINIIPLLGRSQINKYGKSKPKTSSYEIETAVIGRIVLDVWRLMRHEIALQSYTFESIVYHILHRRVPVFSFKDLTFWWNHRTNLYRHRVVSYYLFRVETLLELFHKLDFLNRTSELARLFGIQFYEVLSRGSQFRVESMMLRLAKPLNYVPVSPSTMQRAGMKAPEYIALVMEPESKMYTDPVIVLDFQSLYPSIIIAYNYCFTTCVGRVQSLGTNSPFEFGATQLKVSRRVVEKLSNRNLLNFSPCGVAFVKQKVRRGILPRMLTEILDTRLMVKNSMKENKSDENLQKVLHNRQLGLKLIANVTFGYTAANFSGRMCCVEVGDTVVSKARETLQRAIALVDGTPEWGARVVYGDTDSLFVMVPGKTKEVAFEVGKKIADAVTADNPDPIKLKLEKVYQPCILQTKKRYVGYMYESPDQKEPVYDAKGIETVRRDGCPAVSKMLKKCLTLLFETKDVSLIKQYILRQFHKIQAGRASIQDLTFAKEYRGASGYKPGACVPALELARKWTVVDRRSEPRSGERVPYIIVNGPPGLPLIRLVRSPRDLLNDSSLRPNSLYYITKVIIPPINRCFNLIGADLRTWFNQMPRKNTQYLPNSSPIIKSTISQYFVSRICASCSQPTQDELCDRCCRNVNVTTLTLMEKLKKWEENYYNTMLICQTCAGHLNEIACISLDCPVLYRRTQTYNDLQQATYVRELLDSKDIFAEVSVFDD